MASSTSETRSAQPHIRVFLLGRVAIEDGNGKAISSLLAQPKRFALLVYLILARPYGAHRRESLLGKLWPDMDPERGRAALRRALHFIRSALPEGVLIGHGDEEVGIDRDLVWCDAVEFSRAIATNDSGSALEMYHGELMPGFSIDDTPDWEHWLEDERARLQRAAIDASGKLRDAAEARGDLDAAIEMARRCVELSPFDEQAFRELLRVQRTRGDRVAALQEYDAFAKRLQAVMESEPSPETRGLADAIRDDLTRAAAEPPSLHETVPAPVAMRQAATVTAHATVRWTRRATTVAAAFATAAVIVAALVFKWKHEPAIVPSPGRIAVLPFTVRGAPSIAYLGDGMMDMLSTELDGAGAISIVDPHALVGFMKSNEKDANDDIARGKRIAERFGAGQFILGSVVELGGRMRVTASLYDANGERRAVTDASATNEGELFALVDGLARSLLAHEQARPDQRLGRVAAYTTTSVAGLKAYLRGEAEMRAGKYAQSAVAFGEAAEQDSTFALALYRLSIALDWSGGTWHGEFTPQIIRRAMRHSARLSAYDGLLVRAQNEYWNGSAPRSEQLFLQAVAARPSEIEAWRELGEVRFHRRTFTGQPIIAARAPFERVAVLDTADVSAHVHLARLSALEGKPATLREHVAWIERHGSDRGTLLEMRALLAFVTPDEHLKRQVLDSLPLLNSDPVSIDGVYLIAYRVGHFTRNPNAGASIASVIAQRPPHDITRAIGFTTLAHMHVAQGMWRAAYADLSNAGAADQISAVHAQATLVAFSAVPLAAAAYDSARATLAELGIPKRAEGMDWFTRTRFEFLDVRTHYLTGVLALAAGEDAEAAKEATWLSAQGRRTTYSYYTDRPQLDSLLTRHLAAQLRARIALKHGDARAALALMEAGWPTEAASQSELYVTAAERMVRAEALAALGRETDAIDWYASVSEDIGLSASLVGLAHLRMGPLLERVGRQGAAREAYADFVSRYQNCDPEFKPLVRQAAARVRQLSS